MKSRSGLIIGLALVLIGLAGLITVGLLGAGGPSGLTCPGGGQCFGGRNTPDTRMDGGVSPRGETDGSMDAMFIVGMVPHHEDAIEMAELALTRAEHPELKALAQRIIDTQSAEVEQMEEWYLDWYGEEVPADDSFGMMGGGMMDQGSDMAALEQAESFDAEFIRQMIPHHQMGIMMAQMVSQSRDHAEIRGLADDIIEGQSAEIELMSEWYDEWYGN